MGDESLSPAEAATQCQSILDNVKEAVIVQDETLERILIGVLARGHILLEDVPGTGKTLTARSFASALGLSFNRIQFTPDLLPADITGSNVYREGEGTFEFVPGPIFDNVVLADELNRAPPKTQAALLEAMEEGQVSVDGETHPLPDPFMVIATQNPVDKEGTFVLPEAERDRFIIQTTLGYPSFSGEQTLLDRRGERRSITPTVEATIDRSMVQRLQGVPESVHVDDGIRDYIINIARATRSDDRVDLGVSPRGIQRFFEATRSRAVLHGRDFVIPDDVKSLAKPVLNHRLILTTEASIDGATTEGILDNIISGIEVPSVDPEGASSTSENEGVITPAEPDSGS